MLEDWFGSAPWGGGWSGSCRGRSGKAEGGCGDGEQGDDRGKTHKDLQDSPAPGRGVENDDERKRHHSRKRI